MLKESRRVEEDGERRGQLIALPGRFARDPLTYATRSVTDAATKKEPRVGDSSTEARAGFDENNAHIDPLRREKRRTREPAILHRLTVAAPAAQAFFHGLAARGGALGPTLHRMERLLDLYSPAELQVALLAVADLPAPQIHDIHILLGQRRRQLSLPPPIGIHLPEDSPLRAVSVTPYSLASYDSIRMKKEDSHDPR